MVALRVTTGTGQWCLGGDKEDGEVTLGVVTAGTGWWHLRGDSSSSVVWWHLAGLGGQGGGT